MFVWKVRDVKIKYLIFFVGIFFYMKNVLLVGYVLK